VENQADQLKREDLRERPFRICLECRALTPMLDPVCVRCGKLATEMLEEIARPEAQSAHSVGGDARPLPQSPHDASAEDHFLRGLLRRPVRLVPFILGINGALYLLMVSATGGSFGSQFLALRDLGTLVAFGAKTNELLQQGEWFRLLTPIFLHGGLLHLATNSWALWVVGPLVERLYGPVRFSALYLLAGVGGVVGSYVGSGSRAPYTPSVGASGAIFGLFGVLLVFAFKYRRELPPLFQRSIRSGILPVILLNLFLGFSLPFIDNGAHLGGLVTGALVAFLLPYLPLRASRDVVGLRAEIGRTVGVGVALLLVLVAFVSAYRHRQPHLARRTVEVQRFLAGIDRADEVLTRGFRWVAGTQEEPTNQSADRLRLDLAQAADALAEQGAPDMTAGHLQRQLLDLLRRQQLLLTDSTLPPSVQSWRILGEDLMETRRALRDWIGKDGARYGLQLREEVPASTPDRPPAAG
jgi:membrane associated rhomboid family serine protease